MKQTRSSMQDVRPVAPLKEDESLFEELDQHRSLGRGSCCTLWSFQLLFGTLVLLGSALLLWLRRG